MLIISADPNVVETLDGCVRQGDYHAIVARSAAEGLVTLEHTRTAVVIADEMLADVSGGDLLSIVAKDHSETLRILLTSDPSGEPTANLTQAADVHRVVARDKAETEVMEAIRTVLPFLDSQSTAAKGARALAKSSHDLERAYPGIMALRSTSNGSIDLSEIEIDSVSEDIHVQLKALNR